MDEDILMECVKSRYVLKGFLPTSGNYIMKRPSFRSPQGIVYECIWIFGTVKIGAGKLLKKSFVLAPGGGKDRRQLGVGKPLLLFRMCGERERNIEENAFIQIWSARRL